MRLVIELQEADAARLDEEAGKGRETWLKCGAYMAQVRVLGPAPDAEGAPVSPRAGRHVRRRAEVPEVMADWRRRHAEDRVPGLGEPHEVSES